MSSIANPISGSSTNVPATSTGSSTAASANDKLGSESTFLTLLVAQIKNQDPTNPTDATQFVGQLTQYSELEQLINLNTNVQKLDAPAASTTTTPSGTTATTPAT